MDAACGVIGLGMGAMWLICRKRGATKTAWKILLGLIIVQMLTTVALQFVPIERNRYQLLFWGFMSAIQCALVNDMRENSPASVPRSMSHSMMLLNKIIFGVETAVLIFAVGMLICYGERSFPGQIIRRHFHCHLVTGQNPDEIHSELSGNMR